VPTSTTHYHVLYLHCFNPALSANTATSSNEYLHIHNKGPRQYQVHSSCSPKYPSYEQFVGNIHQTTLACLEGTLQRHMIHRRQGIDSTNNNRQAMEDACQSIAGMSPTEHVCAAHEDKILCSAVIGNKNTNIIYLQ
jgi:hypothetical protein